MNYDLNTTLIFGITFGIVFMTIVYTFVRYVASKDIVYISYSFMQVFSLGFIVLYSGLYYESKLLQDIFLLLATLFAFVFAFSFYEGRFIPELTNTKELIINTLLLNVVILTAFYHYMLFEYLPYTVIYAILFISVVFNLKEGIKPTLVYVVGWSIFCFLLFVFDFKTIYLNSGFIDIVLLAFAIEAILFTMSVSYKYASLQKQTQNYEDMLLQQSRLAQSGEMIGNITHQFRQPLNNISYIMINLKKRFSNDKLDSAYFTKKTEQIDEQLQFLSTTIDHFKEFYTPNKNKELFILKDAIDSSLTVLSSEFKKRNITLNYTFKVNDGLKVSGVQNELSQVILSILSNASDALKDIETPIIDLEIDATNAEIIIVIKNNGKLIEKRDLEKIFEPYYSTKKEGTGIGLYLSQLIIQRSFHGKIEASNLDNKVVFTITLEKAI